MGPRYSGKTILLAALATADQVPLADVLPFPRPERTGPGRAPPEVEARFERLKAFRNQTAKELGLARGILFPNATLLAIAWSAPTDIAGLGEIPALKRWQLALAGDELLKLVAE